MSNMILDALERYQEQEHMKFVRLYIFPKDAKISNEFRLGGPSLTHKQSDMFPKTCDGTLKLSMEH